jgi:hypothetical protein
VILPLLYKTPCDPTWRMSCIVFAKEVKLQPNLSKRYVHPQLYFVSTNREINSTFVWPSIVMYFYSNTNQMHNISNFILFWNNTLHVSDGLSIYHQESKTTYCITYMSYRFLWLLASENELELQFHFVPNSKQTSVSVGHTPDAVCTVLDSWWWTERPSEICRVLFQNKINLRYCASGWFYYRNIGERNLTVNP